jgi:2-C-methyl-D-erythritol 2,4-cyclodiphosphate synthase
VSAGDAAVFRIGLGTDLHRLVEGRRLVLGGVTLPCSLGAESHSDGDALIHAVIDALLGAACLGDIGELFPNNDFRWKDADSRELLRQTAAKLNSAGWDIVNIDAVVSCEEPKILPYRDTIRASLAGVLNLSVDHVFVKGKTGEGMGDVGEGRAVSVIAVCLIRAR